MNRAAAIVGVFGFAILHIAPQSAGSVEPSPEFRRVFAPADRAADWPFRPERYLPIPAAQFEQAMRQAQQSAAPPVAAAVVEVRLTVRYDGRERLTGQAVLTLKPVEAGPRLIPLAATSVPLVQAVWRETNTPAVLGNTLDGATAVWVERPGTLVCQWSGLGVRDPLGGVVFDVPAIGAATSSLSLTLPAGFELQDAAPASTSSPPTASQETTYEIRPLAPRRLRIVSTRAASAAAPRFALRQDVDYEYSELGIDMTIQLRIDAVDEPLTKLEIETDPGLRIVDARFLDRRLTWTDVEPVPTPRRTIIEFDPPLFGTGRTVLLRGLAPAQIAKRHVLPTVRCPTLDWQQGTLSLAVAAPLTMDRIDPTGCTAGTPTPLAGERTGEAVEFTCYDPKASLRVLISRQRETVEATGVTTVSFADDETKAEHRVELRSTAGERFLLQAAVPSRWIVDSVTAATPTALADWTLSEVREKHRWLTIRLTQALKPDRPLRLTIAARTKRPGAGTTLDADDLRIVEFRDVRSDAPIVAVRAADSWNLELNRERTESTPTVDALDPLRRELLGEFIPEFLLDLRPTAEPWQLTPARRSVRLDVEIAAAAAVGGDQLTETYRIQAVEADGAALDRLEVQFSPGRSQAVAWSWEGSRSGGLQARRTSTTGTGANSVETWEIAFPTPQSGPIALRAVRRSTFEQSVEPSLAAVVDGEGSGTLVVESDAATPVAVDRANLRPLPVKEASSDSTRRIRGRFSYESAQDVAADVPRRPTIRRMPPEARSAPAIVWDARQQTIYEADGRTVQRIRLWVQSLGGESFRWNLPAEAERTSIRVNGEPVELRGATVVVPLPPISEFVTVTAEYQEQINATGPLRLASTRPLDVDVPVLHIERDVRLPPHYAPLDASLAERTDDSVVRLRRLIEPLLRHNDAASTTSTEATKPAAKTSPLWDEGALKFSPGVPTTSEGLWLARGETTAALQFAAALLAGAFALRRLVRRRTWFWIAVGLTSALTTVLPSYFASIAVWLLYGITAAAACEIVLPKLTPRKSRGDGRIGTLSAPPPSTTTVRPSAVLPRSIVLALALTATATAQERPTVATAPPASTVVPEVLIPVGDDGKPNGERYQVPERLWRLLERRVADNDLASRGGVLLADADYTAVIAHDARRARHLLSEFRAVWNAHVVVAPTETAVPFSSFDAAATAVLVDGRPVELVRSGDGRRLRLAFDKVGPHRIEVIARTAALEPPLGSGASVSVPRVNDGRIRILTPAELTGLTVAEAAETPTAAVDRRSHTAKLSPSDSLTITWNETDPADAVEFEQYEWWRVRPGTVTVDLKLRVVSPTAAGREITLIVDPRLQWLPRRTDGEEPEVAASPVLVEQATVGRRLKLTLPATLRPDQVVEATFLVNGASGVGRMRLPELRVERHSTRRRLFAASVDPTLDPTFTGAVGVAPVAVPEFERVWGAATALPQAAFELTASRNDWSLSTRPKPTRLSAAEVQTLVCGRRRVEMTYEAEITPSGDAVTRLELAAPSDLDVASVSVVDPAGDGEEHALRFTRDDLGAVIVLLRAPLPTAHKLTLRGRWNVPTAGDASFPFMQLRGTAGGTRQVQLVRLPEANVELLAAKNLTAETPEPNAIVNQDGRPVGAWKVSAPNPTAKLKITPNAPKIAAQAVSTLRRELQAWEYEFVAQLDVADGVADEVHLDFPAEIALPLTVIPTMPYEASALGEDGRRRLVLRPREPVRGKFQFALRGDLTALDREHPVPSVRLMGAASVEYYFQLPARNGLNRAAWDVDQLAPAPLPNGFAKPTAEEVVTFRALGTQPSATLREVRRSTGRPTVRLADHRVRTSPSGDDGVSVWLIEPSGAAEFKLVMPDGAQVLAVRCGGAETAAVEIAPHTFRIPAASEQISHVVEVAYRLRVRSNSSVGHRQAPKLEELPIERTLWTVVDEYPNASWSSLDAATAADLQAQRARIFATATNELKTDPGRSDATAWIDSLERRRVRAAEPSVGRPHAGEIVDLDYVWDATDDVRSPHFYFSTPGEASQRIRDEPLVDSRGSFRLGDLRSLVPAASTCLFVAGLLWLAGRRDGLWRWSAATGVLIGLAWIVWLQPTAVGWIILTAIAGTRVHGSLRKARERRTALLGGLRTVR